MTKLVPMSAKTLVHYLAVAIAGYAKDNVDSGRWPEEGAIERSHADFAALEPLVRNLGLSSIGLHVFSNNAGAQALYRKLGYGGRA